MPLMRMSRAISFGVFCRLAPSTSAIIRSRNVSPGWEVIRTTIRSDSTTVPPVTADLSPPASRSTGADSPVIADSSTTAMPSMTSPSPGMTWFAVTTHRSPNMSWVDGTASVVPSGLRRWATVSLRALRSVSAWALPPLRRRLGEVGEQHGGPQPEGDQAHEHAGPGGELDGGDDGAHLDQEHDRVADHRPRVELEAPATPRYARWPGRPGGGGPYRTLGGLVRPEALAAPGRSRGLPGTPGGLVSGGSSANSSAMSGSESRSISRSSTRTRPIGARSTPP